MHKDGDTGKKMGGKNTYQNYIYQLITNGCLQISQEVPVKPQCSQEQFEYHCCVTS